MASWISITTFVSALAAFRLNVAAFAIFCFGVAALFLTLQIDSGSRMSTVFIRTILLTASMQLGYMLGVLKLAAGPNRS